MGRGSCVGFRGGEWGGCVGFRGREWGRVAEGRGIGLDWI